MSALWILRGLPGSGKSTLAKSIVEMYKSIDHACEVCSADDFFVENGIYRFDGSKLAEAHSFNREKARIAMDRLDHVVIDNTNTTRSEFQPYLDMAKESKYYYYTLIAEPRTDVHLKFRSASSPDETMEVAEILSKRNTHGVPKTSILKMMERWEIWPTGHWLD